MSSSTRLLFKLIRYRLAFGTAILPVFFCVALINPHLATGYPTLILFVGLILTHLMGLPSLLNQTLFPITDRQAAWIPMATWGLLSLCGAVGLMLGQGLGIIMGSFSFDDSFSLSISTFPFTLFLLFLLWRFLIVVPGFTLFITYFYLFKNDIVMAMQISPILTDLCLVTWPLWIGGTIFLIWEAPQQMATLRRVEYEETKTFLGTQTHTPRTDRTFHRSWATFWTDSLMYISVVFFLGISAIHFLRDDFSPGSPVFNHVFFGIVGLLISLLLVILPVLIWRRNRASGMSRSRAALILLIEMTGVGYVIRERLGVPQGELCRCRFCRNWRLIWQKECPHCANWSTPSEPQPESVTAERSWTDRLLPRHDPEALFFRGIGPLILLCVLIAEIVIS